MCRGIYYIQYIIFSILYSGILNDESIQFIQSTTLITVIITVLQQLIQPKVFNDLFPIDGSFIITLNTYTILLFININYRILNNSSNLSLKLHIQFEIFSNKPINLQIIQIIKGMLDNKLHYIEPLSSCDQIYHQKSCEQRTVMMQQMIQSLTEALLQIDSNLKNLDKEGPFLSKEDLLLKIRGFIDVRETLNLKSNMYEFDTNFFSHRQSALTISSSILSMDSVNKIEVEPEVRNEIYEVPVELENMIVQQDIEEYLCDVQQWNNLSPGLQKAIEAIIKTKSAAIILQMKEYVKIDSQNMSFSGNEKCHQEHFQNSFSISQVRKKQIVLANNSTQTIHIDKKNGNIQSVAQLEQISQYCLQKQEDNEDWREAEYSLKKIQSMFAKIPIKTQELNAIHNIQGSSQQISKQGVGKQFHKPSMDLGTQTISTSEDQLPQIYEIPIQIQVVSDLQNQQESQQYESNIDAFRVTTEQNRAWEDVSETMLNMQKLFSHKISQNQHEYKPNFIMQQLCNFVSEGQAKMIGIDTTPQDSVFVQQCNQKKTQIEKDWLQISAALNNIQKALYQVPIMKMEEQYEQLYGKQITVNQYEIPIQIQEIQNQSQTSLQNNIAVQQNRINEIFETIKFSYKQQITLVININDYQIPIDMELIDSENQSVSNIQIKKQFKICGQTYNQTIQQLKENQEEELDEDCQFYELPVEVNVLNNYELAIQRNVIDQKIIFKMENQVQVSKRLGSQAHHKIEIKENSNHHDSPSEQLETSIENLQLNLSVFNSSAKPKKSVNTSRHMNENSSNRTKFLDVDESDGNLTDRSILLRRNLGASHLNNTPCLSFLEKQQEIAPQSYYQLVEHNSHLEQQIQILRDYIEGAQLQLSKLNSSSQKQNNFIEGMKIYYGKQKKYMSNQLQSYQYLIQEATQKYEIQTQKTERQSQLIEQLQQTITKMKIIMADKMNFINDSNQNFEEERLHLWEVIRGLRADLEDMESDTSLLRKQYDHIVDSLQTESEIQREQYIQMKNQMEKLRKQIQTEQNFNEQLKSNITESIGKCQKAVTCNSQAEDVPEFKQFYKIQFSQMHTSVLQKSQQVLDLENKHYLLERQMQNILKQNDFVLLSKNEEVQKLQNRLKISEQQLAKKYLISPLVQNQIDYLRKQLVLTTQQTMQKDREIIQLNTTLNTMKIRNESLSINFVPSVQLNQNYENITEQDLHMKKLQDIIFQYQHIISYHQSMIKELQDQVYEYLGEALDKQQELEALCQQFFTDRLDTGIQNNQLRSNDFEGSLDKFDYALKQFGNNRKQLNNHRIPKNISEKEDQQKYVVISPCEEEIKYQNIVLVNSKNQSLQIEMQ